MAVIKFTNSKSTLKHIINYKRKRGIIMDRKTICIYGSFSPYVSEEKLKPYYDMGKKLGEKYDLIYGGIYSFSTIFFP